MVDATQKFILHGCNAQGVMGSGVAKDIRTKYPSAYDKYKLVQRLDGLHLGDAFSVAQDDGKVIINAITQEFYGREVGKRYCSYDAISECIRRLNFTPDYCGQSVAMPKIGAGFGGGDWRVISLIIEKESTNFQPVVYFLNITENRYDN